MRGGCQKCGGVCYVARVTVEDISLINLHVSMTSNGDRFSSALSKHATQQSCTIILSCKECDAPTLNEEQYEFISNLGIDNLEKIKKLPKTPL